MALSPARMNPPCEVHFAGWKSDTYSLGRAGWKVSIEEYTRLDYSYGRQRMLLHHPELGLNGIAESQGDFQPSEWRHHHMTGRLPVFVVKNIVARTMYRVNDDLSNFRDWHDTVPAMIVVSEFDLYHLPLFQKIAKPVAEELIVDPLTVSELLDQIRKRQAPGQAEIRQRDRSRETPTMHAQILTFPMAA